MHRLVVGSGRHGEVCGDPRHLREGLVEPIHHDRRPQRARCRCRRSGRRTRSRWSPRRSTSTRRTPPVVDVDAHAAWRGRPAVTSCRNSNAACCNVSEALMTRSIRTMRSVVSLPTCRVATRVRTATCACRIASSGPTSASHRLQFDGHLVGVILDERQEHRVLGGEVPAERARRHVGRRRDLLDGGLLVALLQAQLHGGVDERRPRPLLLALAQAGRRLIRHVGHEHDVNPPAHAELRGCELRRGSGRTRARAAPRSPRRRRRAPPPPAAATVVPTDGGRRAVHRVGQPRPAGDDDGEHALQSATQVVGRRLLQDRRTERRRHHVRRTADGQERQRDPQQRVRHARPRIRRPARSRPSPRPTPRSRPPPRGPGGGSAAASPRTPRPRRRPPTSPRPAVRHRRCRPRPGRRSSRAPSAGTAPAACRRSSRSGRRRTTSAPPGCPPGSGNRRAPPRSPTSRSPARCPSAASAPAGTSPRSARCT